MFKSQSEMGQKKNTIMALIKFSFRSIQRNINCVGHKKFSNFGVEYVYSKGRCFFFSLPPPGKVKDSR